MKKEVLGVKIDDISMIDAVARIEKWIRNTGKRYIVTPNPEFIVMAQEDTFFKSILNNADLSIPDGYGLKFSGKVKNTLSGVDLMEKLIELSAEKGFTIGLLGGRDGIAKKCAECLSQKYPNLKVKFAESGGEVDNEGKLLTYPKSVKSLNCNLLFVAFGPPKQEKWIANNFDKIPIKIAMGVGGAFDYLSGSIPRAPVWIRGMGFEWLFRLVFQPRRIKRQLSLVKYFWLLTKYR